MRKISLTQSKFALVDNDDYGWINQWKWFAYKSKQTYYASRISTGRHLKMHRLILGFEIGDGNITDHIDGNGLNNQRANLRKCTNQQNNFNRRLNPDSSSRFKGVTWHKRDRNG